jgi:ArsR family transcriptional regulator, arsenate/arsenite/antimonite-responsive transcriptional repressor / arsenate reductase (thioredoxin)
LRPRHISEVRQHGDLVIRVCDLAHEELAEAAAVRWSIPDPVPAGDPDRFDAALAKLAGRVARFAPAWRPSLYQRRSGQRTRLQAR